MNNEFENNYKNWHTYWSYLKSAIRIAGCITVLWYVPFNDMLACLAFSFLLAELIGILEEMF
jgi:hypothetical protein